MTAKTVCDIRFIEYLPPIDGHFWFVHEDGTIEDPWFGWYDYVIKVNGLDRNKQHYLPADDITQQLATRFYEKALPEPAYQIVKKHFKGKPQKGYCYVNVRLALEKNKGKGKIVFGSMGWTIKDTTKIHYEFGGTPEQGYRMFKDFRR